MRDYFGRTIQPGHWLHYVTRHGSYVNQKLARVVEVSPVYLLVQPVDYQRAWLSRKLLLRLGRRVKLTAQADRAVVVAGPKWPGLFTPEEFTRLEALVNVPTG